MSTIDLNGRCIEQGGRTLVIAEIGVNHDGSCERAIELVNVAAECQADAVKLQLFQANRLMHSSAKFAEYQQDNTADESPTAMLKRYELSSSDIDSVVAEIRRLGMLPLATPFSPQDVEIIDSLDLPAIKIASPDIVNWPLLRRAAQTERPLLISTGASTINEISSSLAWLRGWGSRASLLHCVSSYPTPNCDTNLCWINELIQRFSLPVGFSDHTTEIFSGALSVAAGACIVEKHLTYDRFAQGPDHATSCSPTEFAQYISLIRTAEMMRGKTGKHVLDIERDVRTVSRQSLVVTRDLGAGHFIREEDLTVQRPGTGIPASAMPSLVGRRVDVAIQAGQMLTWNVLSDAA